MISKNKKIYIIGQGIAGSVLAFLLSEEGFNVTVIDDGHKSSSSIVAAGMWNPLSFRKLNLSWDSHLFLPVANELYRRMEKATGGRFHHEMPLARIFPDAHAANDWDSRSTNPAVKDFISDKNAENIASQFRQPFGHGVVTGTGWLDMPVFLESCRKYFTSKRMFREEKSVIPDPIQQDELYIDCTGWKANQHAALTWLPIIPNKGEVLTLKSDALHLDLMVNFGKFIIPVGENSFKLGSTHEIGATHLQPTDEAAAEMVNNLVEHCDVPFSISSHVTGFRPTTPDRKPLIGMHPANPGLAVFNGFGSRGVMQVPWFARQFSLHLATGSAIDRDVNVARYYGR